MNSQTIVIPQMSIKFSTLLKIYLQAAAFRFKNGLKSPVYTRKGKVFILSELVAHDFLHVLTGLSISKQDEATLVRIEEVLTGKRDWTSLSPDLVDLVGSGAERYWLARQPEAEVVFQKLYDFLQF